MVGGGVDSEGVMSRVGEDVGREGGARDGGSNFVMGGGGDGMRNRVVVRSGAGEGVRREERMRGVVGGRTLGKGGVKHDFDVLLLVRSESIHHRFARFTLLHDL